MNKFNFFIILPIFFVSINLHSMDLLRKICCMPNQDLKKIWLMEKLGNSEETSFMDIEEEKTLVKQRNQNFLEAVKNNDHKMIKSYLAFGIDVNVTDSNDYTALMFACINSNKELIETLLNNPKTSINAVTRNRGSTALMIACLNCDLEIINIFLKRSDVNINVKSIKGYTPLIIAVSRNDCQIINMLLERPEIEINAHDHVGRTALSIATMHENAEILQNLSNHPQISLDHSATSAYPFFRAIELQNPKMLKLLSQKHDMSHHNFCFKKKKVSTDIINWIFEGQEINSKIFSYVKQKKMKEISHIVKDGFILNIKDCV